MQARHKGMVCREHGQSHQHEDLGGFRHTVIKNSWSSTTVNPKLKGNLPVRSCQNWHAQYSTPYKAKPSSCTGDEWLGARHCRGSLRRVGPVMLMGCGRRWGNWQRRPTGSVKLTFPSPWTFLLLFITVTAMLQNRSSSSAALPEKTQECHALQDHTVRTFAPTHFQKLNLSPFLQPWPVNCAGGRNKLLVLLHWIRILNVQHAIH